MVGFACVFVVVLVFVRDCVCVCVCVACVSFVSLFLTYVFFCLS